MRKSYDTEPKLSDCERGNPLLELSLPVKVILDTSYSRPMVRVFLGEIQIGVAFQLHIPTNPAMNGRWEYAERGAYDSRSSYYDSPEEAAAGILVESGFVADADSLPVPNVLS